MREAFAAVALALVVASAPAWAREAPSLAADAALEVRVMEIASELRCLVCQNETLAASHADLAVDLRAQIRRQLQEGRTPAQIRDYMVQRFGEFVLYRPRFQAKTLLLWLGPFALLLLAFWALWRGIRARGSAPAVAPVALAQCDRERARELLGLSEEPRS